MSPDPALVIQPDGKIVAAGLVADGNAQRNYFALARYNLNGSLDPGFGTGGVVLTDFGTSPSGAHNGC